MKLLFLRNNLVGYDYAEPYAGGASVALTLLYEEYVSNIHINDINRSVFAFWYSVLNETEELCRRITDVELSIDQWRLQKDVQTATDPDILDLGFSTFYLNRTNRSGIIGGGVIGGKNQDGNYGLDARFNKKALIDRIKKVARYKNRITLTQLDAAEYLRAASTTLPERSVFYLDPPYYVKGEGLYQNFYQHEDHCAIAMLVQSLKQPWIVSYDAAPQIVELYRGVSHFSYNLNYSASKRYAGGEVMFFSANITSPEVPSPANVSAKLVKRIRKENLNMRFAGM
jgi:DNA adenine methylase